MLSEEQAFELKKFLWSELPIEIMDKLPHDVPMAINKVIDKAVDTQKEELAE